MLMYIFHFPKAFLCHSFSQPLLSLSKKDVKDAYPECVQKPRFIAILVGEDIVF